MGKYETKTSLSPKLRIPVVYFEVNNIARKAIIQILLDHVFKKSPAHHFGNGMPNQVAALPGVLPQECTVCHQVTVGPVNHRNMSSEPSTTFSYCSSIAWSRFCSVMSREMADTPLT